ncbi:hypothetical protein BJ944DRAFT_269325 [Cunninghamella echinulata]|nr:hypothetical protein BJ944DRAFT_269325 [Cunninghamella echinulata]
MQMDQVNNNKPSFLNKQLQQPQPQQQHGFITLSSVNIEEDSIYDHTKKVKRMNHQPPISETPINLVFKETLNKEFTLNVNPPPIPLVPLSSLDKPQKNNNESKKKVIPPIATTFSINNYNHKFSNNNNNNNNKLLYPSTSQSRPPHSSSSSQSSSQSTKKNNTKADTHLSSNNNNKNKNRGKSYNKPSSTKKKLNKSSTEGGHKRIRQQQQQQQQDPFTTSLITPLDATTDWVCLFCQYEIFMNGWIATQKKKRSAQKRKAKRMRNKSKQQQNEECDECETRSSATCESEYEH